MSVALAYHRLPSGPTREFAGESADELGVGPGVGPGVGQPIGAAVRPAAGAGSRPSVRTPLGPTRRVQAGMTILELLIALVLIGLLMVMAVVGVRWLRSSSLRETATEMAAALRASYNAATLSAMHHRVVFDLESQSYRVESCEGEVTLTRSERDEAPEEAEDERGDDAAGGGGVGLAGAGGRGGAGGLPPDLAELAGGLPPGLTEGIPGLPGLGGPGALGSLSSLGGRGGGGSGVPSEIANAASPEEAAELAAELASAQVGSARCAPADLAVLGGGGGTIQLPKDDGITIRRMFVQHLEGEQREGVVYLNFFPLGTAEKAAIELVDGDGTTYTLLVHSLTGRIEFRDERVEPEDHVFLRADGERTEER